ncbi:hypothetical protein SAMN02745947_05480 [Rhodococcus rhodochrous J3]|uniref:Telomere-binding protein n=1 Tax=Rhodococcus rhodochrous J3 TaxID=903528 RepID=A0ABY1MJ52_RHORH|nr:hypothetical protein [Rhodococcus rhodochrous]MBF4478205.1 hypothetical protein [Rhodococcus rhodochrous]MCD2100430.1 hypothetical protein [Rhodococcus rhodochrous]MCD2124754.1 hypothetical protein [Rhodococcus rhodochrous]MCQ4137857.1 hypothetical protein [Rhodococcus rhodochrous]MDJ0021499.1 hypothetical protein [Rhodococcus rhodochrous]
MSGIDDQIALFDLDPEPEKPLNGSAAPEDTATEAPPPPAKDDLQSADADTAPPDPVDVADIDEAEKPATEVRPWESLPVTEDADGHAIIVTAAATYTPSGVRLTGPVDSIEKLDKLLHWAALTPHGLTAQVWFVGIDSCSQLGWSIDPGSEDDVDDLEQLRQRAATELTQTITASLPPLIAAGWELRGDPGYVIHLIRKVGKATQMVDLVLEPYVWTYWNKDFGWGNRVGDMGILGNPAAGTYLPDDDLPAARELGRRLAWSVKHLDTLPGPTPARTGAAVLDKIRRERLRTGKGIVVTAGGPIPPIDGAPRGDFEPAAGWSRIPDADDLEGATALVTIDQRAAYLASAGMLSFGYGRVRNLLGVDAAAAATSDKPPFGIWRVTLPAAGQYALPEKLPLPHPAMLDDQPVQTWITTISLDGLCAPIADGGMGLDVDDLDITEAWVYEEQGRALDKWAKVLREARAVAAETGDAAMKRFLGACYKGYVGRMVNPDMWTATRMQHHHQPLWRAAIMAHCRWRGRRVAMRIARETGRWPIRTMTDSWVYLVGEGQTLADDSDALGKMVLEKHVELTDEMLLAFAEAETTHEVRLAIAAAHGADHDEEQ